MKVQRRHENTVSKTLNNKKKKKTLNRPVISFTGFGEDNEVMRKNLRHLRMTSGTKARDRAEGLDLCP